MFKAFLLYQQSILFEFEQEKIYHEVFNIKGFIRYFPRSVVIYNNCNRYLFIINYLLFIPLWLSWAILIHPILLIKSFLKWLPFVVKAPKTTLPENVYLSLSDIKYFSYLEETEADFPATIIDFPFHTSKSKFGTKIASSSFFGITSIKKMLQALVLAYLTPFILFFSKERYLMLFTYSSFYWYWTYFSLVQRKLNSIWLSNHYDRWLKLVEGLTDVSKMIMVQHGQLEYVENETGKIYFPTFSNKLKNISKVYIIDDYSKKYFLKIIDNESLVFEKIKSKLNIVEWPVSYKAKYKILILGHQNDFIFHNALIHGLDKNELFDLAYKAHPQQSVENLSNDCWLVTASNNLPVADIIISYGSSLDNEIKQLLPYSTILNYGFNEKFDKARAIKSIELNLYSFLKIEKATN